MVTITDYTELCKGNKINQICEHKQHYLKFTLVKNRLGK